MNTSKQTRYTSKQFTLGDLREIVSDNEYGSDDDVVDIHEDKGDRPFDSSQYTITVRKKNDYF